MALLRSVPRSARQKTGHIRIIVYALAFVIGLSGCQTATQEQSNEQARKELLAFLDGLEAGMSPSSVEELFNRGQYQKLTLDKLPKGNSPRFAIATPLIWGAGNWVAYVDFERDVILAVPVRTQDSADHHPDTAPPDRTFRP